MASSSTSPRPAVLIFAVILRFLVLIFCAGSVVLLFLNRFTLSDGTKATFKDIYAYRYVISTGIAGFVYALAQIPFAIYHACKEERLVRHECHPEFDFYADKVIAFILATGVGAGFAITFELKRFLKDFLDSFAFGSPEVDEGKSKGEKFLDKANIATGLLFFGFLCMAMLSFYSSIQRRRSTSYNTRFFFK